jgi:hypothetical protein
MASFDFVTFAAVFLAVGGLAAVLWEILVKNPRSLGEMMTDSRRFAEASLAGEHTPPAREPAEVSRVAANQNRPRLAA